MEEIHAERENVTQSTRRVASGWATALGLRDTIDYSAREWMSRWTTRRRGFYANEQEGGVAMATVWGHFALAVIYGDSLWHLTI